MLSNPGGLIHEGNARHTDTRRQVLVWVASEFLHSPGMIRILFEAGFLFVAEEKWDEFISAAEQSGGFALGGRLAEAHHGAGIWISPESAEALELMVPWIFVRSVVTGPELEARKVFGLARNGNMVPSILPKVE